MTVLLGTGMRVAECTGITKSDINLSENTISVNHNLIYRVIDGKAGFHITTPKTASGTRIIPILYPEVDVYKRQVYCLCCFMFIQPITGSQVNDTH